MAFDAGAIEATLTLDRSPFRRELRAADREAKAVERRRYRVRMELDDAGAHRRITSLQQRLTALSARSISIRMDANSQGALKTVNRLRRQMSAAGRSQTISVDANTSRAQAATAALRAQLSALDRTRARPTVDDSSINRARESVQETTGAVTLLGRMRARPRVNPRGTAKAAVEMAALGGLIQTLNRGSRIPIMVAGATAAIAALGQVGSAVMAIGRSALQATGVLLTLPAIIAAVAAGGATLMVAFRGFGDALSGDAEQAQEALDKLPPAARAAAMALRGLKQPLSDIRVGVQEAFFAGLAPQLSRLSTTLIPQLGIGLGQVAWALNQVAGGALDFANSQKALADMAFIFLNIRDAFAELAPAVQPFLNALSDITAVGSMYLPGMARTITELALRFESFISTARETGQLGTWIENGIQALRDLRDVAGSIGQIFSGLFTGLRGGGEPASIASVKESLQSVADYINSSGVQQTLIEFTNMFRENLELISNAFRTYIMPAITALRPALENIVAGSGKYFASWLATISQVLQFLAPVINGVAAAFNFLSPVLGVIGGAIATIVAGMMLYRGVMVVVRALTIAWTAVQWALNAAMLANPLGLVIIAIVALIAIVVLCYKRFEGFRNVVNTVWEAIKTGALFVWNNVLLPFFTWINSMIHNYLVPAFLWLWENGIKPAWDAITAGALWLWNKVLQPIFKAMGWIIMNVVIPYYTFLWNTMKVVWAGIWKVIEIAWGMIKIVFALIVWTIKNVLAPPFLWVWRNVIKPAFDGIAAAIKWAWDNVIKPTWELMKLGLAVLTAVFNREKARIMAIWNLVKTLIKAGWDYVNDKVFSPFKEGLRVLADAFDEARGNIKTAWTKIKDAAKAPVRFMIETVYMKGIKPMWDKVADLVDADPLPDVTLPAGFSRGGIAGFARGGVGGAPRAGGILAGQSSWRWGDDQVMPVRRGEGWMVSEIMRDPYERKRLMVMNKFGVMGKSAAAARAKLAEGIPTNLGHLSVTARQSIGRDFGEGSGFARGGWLNVSNVSPSVAGITDSVGNFVKNVATSAFTGDFGGAVDAVFKPIKDALALFGTEGIPGTPYMVADKMNSGVKEYLSGLWSSFTASFGGGANEWVGLESASERLQNAARWARTQHGKPYQWGGGGNPSWDCSGFMAGIENVIRGLRPGRRYTTHSFAGTPPPGWKRGLRSPFTVGVQHGGRGGGHMAGTLMGVNVESGGRGVQVGSGARGTNTFPHRFGFLPVVGDNTAGGKALGGIVERMRSFDSGGSLPPGFTMSFNGTGSPETVFTDEQLHALSRAGVTGDNIHLTVQAAPGESTDQVVDTVLFKVRHASRSGVFGSRRRKL